MNNVDIIKHPSNKSRKNTLLAILIGVLVISVLCFVLFSDNLLGDDVNSYVHNTMNIITTGISDIESSEVYDDVNNFVHSTMNVITSSISDIDSSEVYNDFTSYVHDAINVVTSNIPGIINSVVYDDITELVTIDDDYNSWNYYVDPKYAPRFNAIKMATDSWTSSNPSLTFIRTYDINKAEMAFIFKDVLSLDYASGLYISEALVSDGTTSVLTKVIDVDHGADKNCKDEILYYSEETIADTIKHEIGHMLGLEHSLEPDHLMYSLTEPTSWNIDTLGYNIPKTYDDFAYYE